MDDRTKGLLGALGSYSQADMDGIMCEVSRQAVEEAADLIEQQAAEIERLRADARLLYLALNSRLPRPMCRDCSDSDGTCINNGAEPCDPSEAEEWARTVRDDYVRKMAAVARGE